VSIHLHLVQQVRFRRHTSAGALRNGWRRRSSTLRERYNPDMLWFADDVFTINHRWLSTFAEEMASRNLRIPFGMHFRATASMMRCSGPWPGWGLRIWSVRKAAPENLDAMERRVTVEQIRSVTGDGEATRDPVGLFVMLGLRGEEIEDIDARWSTSRSATPTPISRRWHIRSRVRRSMIR